MHCTYDRCPYFGAQLNDFMWKERNGGIPMHVGIQKHLTNPTEVGIFSFQFINRLEKW